MIPVHLNVLQEASRTIPKDYKVKLVSVKTDLLTLALPNRFQVVLKTKGGQTKTLSFKLVKVVQTHTHFNNLLHLFPVFLANINK